MLAFSTLPDLAKKTRRCQPVGNLVLTVGFLQPNIATLSTTQTERQAVLPPPGSRASNQAAFRPSWESLAEFRVAGRCGMARPIRSSVSGRPLTPTVSAVRR